MNTVLLFYRYVEIADAELERDNQLSICRNLGLKGRILLGREGVNGTVSGQPDAIAKYQDYMNSHQLFSGIEYKINKSPDVPFPKLKVKVRSEIVSLGTEVDVAKTAPRLTPEQFNDVIKDPNVVLFDARNNYESAIGKFRGAVTPNIDLFKEFPAALEQYEDLKDKKIVTYCTGGIRCEKASALMLQNGFKNVYQLDGGIIKYAEQFPDGAFEGDCFVFDARMSVGFKPDTKKIGSCHFCDEKTNTYINCSDVTCNKLVLACDDCRFKESICRGDKHQRIVATVRHDTITA